MDSIDCLHSSIYTRLSISIHITIIIIIMMKRRRRWRRPPPWYLNEPRDVYDLEEGGHLALGLEHVDQPFEAIVGHVHTSRVGVNGAGDGYMTWLM